MLTRYVINGKLAGQSFIALLAALSLIGCSGSDDTKTPEPQLPALSSELILTNASHPVISPDGTLLLFMRDGVWMLRRGDGNTARLLADTLPQPVAAPVWFEDNERVVYYASGPSGSSRNGIFVMEVSNGAVSQLRNSGRDPAIGKTLSGDEVILFEEYDPQFTIGLYSIMLPQLTTSRLNLTGSKPVCSKFGDSFGYNGGENGGRPVVARLSTTLGERVLNSWDAFRIDFLDSNTALFDGTNPSTRGSTPPILFRANLTTGVVDTMYRYAFEPTVSANHRLTFRSSEYSQSQILQLRNDALFLVSNGTGRFSVTATGRVAFESENSIRLSE